ncbi:hypothetical protein Tco_0088687 [Tanacetum coccineum]
MKCPQHYLTNMQEVILFYNGLDVPTRQILDSKGVIPSKTASDAKIVIQESLEYSQKCTIEHRSRDRSTETYDRLAAIQALTQQSVPRNKENSAKRHEENSTIIKEIRASTDAAIRNQGSPIKTLELQIGEMSKVLQERGFVSNYVVSCEDEAKRHNSRAKTKTFGEYYFLLQYVDCSYPSLRMKNRLSLKNDMPPRDKWCMTRSSTKELLTPFENLKRVLRSRRKLFDNPILVESNSPEFDQLSKIEGDIEEEVAKIMAEIMEQYMSKTRENYGSGVTRPTINQDTPFELKGKFLKELCDNTFSGSEHEDANEHIEKVLEIVNLFRIPKVTQDQIMLRAFLASLTGAAIRFKEMLMKCPQHYLTDMQEVILFYNGLDVPTRQILDSKGVIPSKTAGDAKIVIQEMVEYSQKWHNRTSSKTRSTETSDGLAAIQAQLNNLGREIKKVNEKVYAA